MGIDGLANLLAPAAIDHFLAEILGQRPFYIDGPREKLAGLMPWSVLNEVLSVPGLGATRLSLIRKGKLVPREQFLTERAGESRITVSELNRTMYSGGTLSLHAVDEIYPPLGGEARTIERDLGLPIQVNAYASLADSDGLGLRWEDHDVFILQVAGARAWHLNAPTLQCPLSYDNPPRPGSPPEHVHTVAEGDVLYIPRGWWRSDIAVTNPQIYLVLSFRTPTGIDLVLRALMQLRQVSIMKIDVPRFRSNEQQGHYIREVAAEAKRCLDEPGLLLGYLEDLRTSAESISRFSLPFGSPGIAEFRDGEFLIQPLARFPISFRHSESDGSLYFIHGSKRVPLRLEAFSIYERVLNGTSSLGVLRDEFSTQFASSYIEEIVTELLREGLIAVTPNDECDAIPLPNVRVQY